MMRALVCGGRYFHDLPWLCEVLSSFENFKGQKITEVIHGNAQGADYLAGVWARQNKVTVYEYSADWATHGKAAGPIRNAQMLEVGKPDIVIAFPGGAGTADMVLKAKRAGVPVVELRSKS